MFSIEQNFSMAFIAATCSLIMSRFGQDFILLLMLFIDVEILATKCPFRPSIAAASTDATRSAVSSSNAFT